MSSRLRRLGVGAGRTEHALEFLPVEGLPLEYLWQASLESDNAAAINAELLRLHAAAPNEPVTRLPLSYLSGGAAFSFALQVSTHTGVSSDVVYASVALESSQQSC